jgi:hypothetical protein
LLFSGLALGFLPGTPASRATQSGAAAPLFARILMEEVKPGAVAAVAARPYPPGWTTLRSITGAERVWRLGFCDKLADLEKDRPSIDGLAAGLAGSLVSRDEVVAIYMKEFTYRPEVDWSRMRYLDAITIHVRPGHHLEYLEMRRIAVAGHVRGGLDTRLIFFKAITGLPGLTYLILRPMQSMADHDRLRAQGFGEPLSEAENAHMIELQQRAVDREDEQFFRVVP